MIKLSVNKGESILLQEFISVSFLGTIFAKYKIPGFETFPRATWGPTHSVVLTFILTQTNKQTSKVYM